MAKPPSVVYRNLKFKSPEAEFCFGLLNPVYEAIAKRFSEQEIPYAPNEIEYVSYTDAEVLSIGLGSHKIDLVVRVTGKRSIFSTRELVTAIEAPDVYILSKEKGIEKTINLANPEYIAEIVQHLEDHYGQKEIG